MSRGSVRQGGKEELRASILKTYLLRLRAEKGERAARALLSGVGIEPSLVDNETGWVSAGAAKRALKAVEGTLGSDSLRHRGEWVTHPEALGTLVRMLRMAEQPVDAYRYLAANAREITRIGTWELEEVRPAKPAAPGAKDAARPAITAVKMTYRLRDEPGDDADAADLKEEHLLCAAREGELAGMPRIWGLPDAVVVHETCLARGGDACIYDVKWEGARPRNGAPSGAV
ncbi:MAG: serine/threonine protein kinase, partial [Myxococcaceae bacterium]|nr:serine/threonine protein kinase [Myxococcaceae bacterium]